MKALAPPRHHRRAAVAVAIAVAALSTLAACTGSSHSPSVANISAAPSGSSAPSTSASGDAVAYSRCMRSHGVTRYPDPNSEGMPPKTDADQLGVSTSQYQAAQQACQSLYPAGGGSFDDQARQCYLGGVCPPALVQQMMTVGHAFATCMRAHGYPNFPDPTLNAEGRPVFNVSGAGITHDQWHSGPMRDQADRCADASGGGLASE